MAGNSQNPTTMDKNGNPMGGYAAGGFNAQGQWQQNPGAPVQNTAPTPPATPATPAPSLTPTAPATQAPAPTAAPNWGAIEPIANPAQQAAGAIMGQQRQPQWGRTYGIQPPPQRQAQRPQFYNQRQQPEESGGQQTSAYGTNSGVGGHVNSGQGGHANSGVGGMVNSGVGGQINSSGTPPIDTPPADAFGAPDDSILPPDTSTPQGQASDPIHSPMNRRPTLQRS